MNKNGVFVHCILTRHNDVHKQYVAALFQAVNVISSRERSATK